MKKIKPIVFKALVTRKLLDPTTFTLDPLPNSWAQEIKEKGATDTQITKCCKIGPSLVYLQGINDKLIEQSSPKCPSVFYDFYVRHYSCFDMILVMPSFPSVAKHVLTADECHLSLQAQFEACWNDPNPLIRRYLHQKNSYTWHHCATTGVLILVSREIHDACRHTGGNCLWGFKD